MRVSGNTFAITSKCSMCSAETLDLCSPVAIYRHVGGSHRFGKLLHQMNLLCCYYFALSVYYVTVYLNSTEQ